MMMRLHATSSRASTYRICSRNVASPVAVQRPLIPARATADHGVNQIKEGSKELLNAGMRAVADAGDAGKRAVTDVGDAAKGKWDSATHATQDAGKDARKAVTDQANSVGDAAKKAAQNIKEGGAGIAEGAASAVKDGAAAVEKTFRNAK